MIKLIIGLGNPTAEYIFTRHNMGFMVVDFLAQRWGIKINKKRYESLYGTKSDGIYLIKPQTFMNLSGVAVKKWLEEGFDVTDILVIHDDIDLPFGEIRMKEKGGTAGHKGLISIVEEIKRDDFLRLRVGIGRPKGLEHDRQAILEFVLSPFSEEEKNELVVILNKAVDIVETILRKGVKEAMKGVKV